MYGSFYGTSVAADRNVGPRPTDITCNYGLGRIVFCRSISSNPGNNRTVYGHRRQNRDVGSKNEIESSHRQHVSVEGP